MKPYLLLVRDDSLVGQELGRQLMEHGHTVFLSDTDDDLAFLGDVVDAIVDVRVTDDDGASAAVLCSLADRTQPSRGALHEESVMRLPASREAVARFAALIQRIEPTPATAGWVDG